MVVVALGTHLVLSFWSGYIYLSSCLRTMSNGKIFVLRMKPVLHVRHSWAFGASSMKVTTNGLSLWWTAGVNPSGAWVVFWCVVEAGVWHEREARHEFLALWPFLSAQLSFTGVTSLALDPPVPCLMLYNWLSKKFSLSETAMLCLQTESYL